MTKQQQRELLEATDKLEILLSNPRHRVKNWGDEAEDTKGNEVLREDTAATRFCILGGAHHVYPDSYLLKSYIVSARNKLYPNIFTDGDKLGSFGSKWNLRDIRKLLNKTRELIRKETTSNA